MAKHAIEFTSSDGTKWVGNTLGAIEGTRMGFWLMSLAGRVAPGLLGTSIAQKKSLDDLSTKDLLIAAPLLLDQLSDPRCADNFVRLFEGLHKQTQKLEPVNFDHEFSADYGRMLEVAGWLAKENFASFLAGKKGLENMFETVKLGLPKAPPTLEKSTGGSTDPSTPG